MLSISVASRATLNLGKKRQKNYSSLCFGFEAMFLQIGKHGRDISLTVIYPVMKLTVIFEVDSMSVFLQLFELIYIPLLQLI